MSESMPHSPRDLDAELYKTLETATEADIKLLAELIAAERVNQLIDAEPETG